MSTNYDQFEAQNGVLNPPASASSNYDQLEAQNGIQDSQVPGSLSKSIRDLMGSASAASQGAVKGLGQFATGSSNALERASMNFTPEGQILQMAAPQAAQSLNNPVPDYFKNFGAAAQSQYPASFGAGQLAGTAAPMILAPELEVADVGGAAGPGTKLINQLINRTTTGFAQGAGSENIYNPNATPLSTALSGVLGAGLSGVSGVGAIAAKGAIPVASRLGQVIGANVDAADKDISNRFSTIYNIADQANVRIHPANSINYLNDVLYNGTSDQKALTKASPDSLNQGLIDQLESRLSNAQSPDLDARPDSFTASDTHSQLQQIGLNIRNSENEQEKKLWTGLYKASTQDQINGLASQLGPDYAYAWTQAMNDFGKNVIPLRKYSTSLSDIGTQSLTSGLVGLLPNPLSSAGEVAIGMSAGHGAIANAVKRYMSTYNGGPSGMVEKSIPGNILQGLGRGITQQGLNAYGGSQNQ